MKASPAAPIRRLIAYIIDWYLATIVCGTPLMLFNSMKSGSTAIDTSIPPGAEGWLWGSFAILLGLLYYWLLPVLFYGATPGKKLMHLRIISRNTKETPSVGALFLRQGVGVLLIEGAIAFPSQLLRELLARITGDRVVSVIQIVMVIITVISITIGVYAPEKRMLHDFIAGTAEVWDSENK